MSNQKRDEQLWRYLGGQPPTRGFSHKIQSDPALARRLAELSLIECAIRDASVKTEGQRLLRKGFWLPASVIGGVAAMLAVGLVGWQLVTLVPEGTPVAATNDQPSRELLRRMQTGESVQVSEAPLRMAFTGESTRLDFEKQSEVQFEETAKGGKRIRLSAGKLKAEVDAQAATMQVITPHFEVNVIGTRFDVAVESSGSEVIVDEGQVEVHTSQRKTPIDLREGAGWWQLSQGYGVGVATAAKVKQGPVIDELNESVWETHPYHEALYLGESEEPFEPTSESGFTRWKAVWDDDALYVLIEVSDDITGVINENAWANDSAEIFLDTDFERETEYDGSTDYLLFFDPGQDEIWPGRGSALAGPNMTHHTRRTPYGFRSEVRLPWTDLNIRPEEGVRIGFNVASNDNDGTDGTRRAQQTWTPKRKGDWARPNRMGVLILSGEKSP